MRRRAGRLARGMLAMLVALAAASCVDDSVAGPEVEVVTGDPGPAVYSAAGRVVSSSYPVDGRASYRIDDEGVAALELDAGFSTPPVPGRVVFLSNSRNPAEGVRVGRLDGETGPARWVFRMPRGAVWRYALVWSETLRVEVARAELLPGG